MLLHILAEFPLLIILFSFDRIVVLTINKSFIDQIRWVKMTG